MWCDYPVPAGCLAPLVEVVESSGSLDRVPMMLYFLIVRRPLGATEFRWVFDQAVKEVGLTGVVPHGLRHTAASSAISAGADIKVVQRMLGHKTATLTLDLYGHLFPDDLDAVADGMDRGARAAADSLRTA